MYGDDIEEANAAISKMTEILNMAEKLYKDGVSDTDKEMYSKDNRSRDIYVSFILAYMSLYPNEMSDELINLLCYVLEGLKNKTILWKEETLILLIGRRDEIESVLKTKLKQLESQNASSSGDSE